MTDRELLKKAIARGDKLFNGSTCKVCKTNIKSVKVKQNTYACRACTMARNRTPERPPTPLAVTLWHELKRASYGNSCN